MAAAWRTVRVFISSTFRDMHAERDWLVRRVFPALRERLEPHRLHLVEIDLRWGVTKEQADNDEALEVCLREVDECRPFFLGILGERYGWVPDRLPERADGGWGWLRRHAGKSITELEILYGVLNNESMRGRALFCFRAPAFLADVPAGLRADLASEGSEHRRKLEALKARIRASGLPVLENYPCRYVGPARHGGVRLEGLEEFGRRVHEWLWAAIREEHRLIDEPPGETGPSADPLADEQARHERFIESRLRVYVGREAVQQALVGYADGPMRVPCLVTGPQGAGKSAALAKFAAEFAALHPGSLVIPHFVGASAASTSLRSTLWRFCAIFNREFGSGDDPPADVGALITTFLRTVAAAPAGRRVLIVFDALDQMNDADHPERLTWVPWELAPSVKMVVSCVEDSDSRAMLGAFAQRPHTRVSIEPLTAAERERIVRAVPSLSAKTLDERQVSLLLDNPATTNPLFLLVALEELRGFGSFEKLNARIQEFPRGDDAVVRLFRQVIARLEVEFDPEVVRSVLTLLAAARRGLSDRELLGLIEGPGAVMSESRSDLFPVLRQLRPYLQQRGELWDFFHRQLRGAARQHYLADERALHSVQARLADYFEAQEYFFESSEEQGARALRQPPTPRPVNVRKVDELPWHVVRAARSPAALDSRRLQAPADLAADLSFLEAKAEAGVVFELALDLDDALAVPSEEDPRRPTLRLIAEAVRRDAHFISRRPTTLFQCLWNSCWWYDCPDAEAHYQPAPSGPPPAPGKVNPPRRLASLLEDWRARKERATPGFPWLRSLRPPPLPLGAGQRRLLQGHDDAVTSVCVSPDGRWIASGSVDQTAHLWDASTGAVVCRLRLGQSAGNGYQSTRINDLRFSPDGRLGTSHEDGSVCVWDVPGGSRLLWIQGSSGSVRGIGFSPDGRTLAACSKDGTARLWDLSSGALVQTIEGHGPEVWNARFSPAGGQLASASHDHTVRLWPLAEDQQPPGWRRWLPGRSRRGTQKALKHPGEVYGLCYSSDGRRVATACRDKVVRVWDASNGKLLMELRGHEDGVTCAAFSPDGSLLATGSLDHSVRLWDAESGTHLEEFRVHTHWVADVCFSQDGDDVLSASHDRTVRVADARAKAPVRRLRGAEPVQGLCFSRDGRQVATVADDRTVLVWDAVTGTLVTSKSGDPNRLLDGFAAPDAPGPWRAGRDGLDLQLYGGATRDAIAWFPVPPGKGFITSPTGRTFAWPDHRHLYLIALEGLAGDTSS